MRLLSKTCEICATDFQVESYRDKTARFCSRVCGNRFLANKKIGTHLSEETKKKIGIATSGSRGGITVVDRECLTCSIPFFTRLSYVKRGQGCFCSVKCRVQMSKGRKFSLEHLAKISGENANNWQGGKTSENQIIRHRKEYREWRTAVYKRDNYTCQECQQIGGKLNADHIKPFAHYPELRFELSNGRTLCVECHYKTDTFGHKINRVAPQLICR